MQQTQTQEHLQNPHKLFSDTIFAPNVQPQFKYYSLLMHSCRCSCQVDVNKWVRVAFALVKPLEQQRLDLCLDANVQSHMHCSHSRAFNFRVKYCTANIYHALPSVPRSSRHLLYKIVDPFCFLESKYKVLRYRQ